MTRELSKPRYYAVADLQKVVCTTQRAGSTAMIEAMRPAHTDSEAEQIEVADVLARRSQGWPVLLWVRDPFEKFASAYAIFGAGRIPPGQAIPRYTTPSEFAQAVLQHKDAHWASQTRMHTVRAVFLPTRVYPFYNLADTWTEEMPGYPLVHQNETRRQSWDEIKWQLSADEFQKLEDLYHDDNALLRWCNEYGVHEVAA